MRQQTILPPLYLVFSFVFSTAISALLPPCDFTDREAAFANITGKSYNPKLPPNHEITVEVRILLINFFGVNELDGTINSNVNFFRMWRDQRLQSKCSHQGLVFESGFTDRFWIPPIGIGAAIGGHRPATPGQTEWVTFFPGGMIVSSAVMVVKISCFKDFSRFPFDPMYCDFVLDPGSVPLLNLTAKWHSTYPVDLTKETNHLSTHQVLGYKIVRLHIEPAPNITLNVDVCRVFFKRHYFHYILHAYVPNTLTVFVAWLSFCIDASAIPARVTLSISSLIAMILMYGNLSQGIPKVGYMTSMDFWMMACEMFIFATLVEFAYLCNLRRTSPHDHTSRELHNRMVVIDKTAQIVYPIAFLLFAVVFFVFTVGV